MDLYLTQQEQLVNAQLQIAQAVVRMQVRQLYVINVDLDLYYQLTKMLAQLVQYRIVVHVPQVKQLNVRLANQDLLCLPIKLLAYQLCAQYLTVKRANLQLIIKLSHVQPVN